MALLASYSSEVNKCLLLIFVISERFVYEAEKPFSGLS